MSAMTRTERQVQIQSALPLNLIPIRIDLTIPSFRPEAPLPTPNNAREFGIDENLAAYKAPEPTPQYRLKDYFLWNLHEALLTPDQFARVFVNELDFPNDRKPALIMNISTQIREQLEEYAGVAMHPLFHSTHTTTAEGNTVKTVQSAQPRNQPNTPATNGQTSAAEASVAKNGTSQPSHADTATTTTTKVKASAKPIPVEDLHNPDDTYRCIINLNINLLNQLYSDKFEWSLLHPPGFAEIFAKQTCADLGLAGEWVPALTHAIYEAVLRLKKEACENGGLVGYGDMDNDAAEGAEAGWRYEPEHLADDWEPKVEILSKEEIERREGDRERQIRRLRRDTARFSSTANMSSSGMPQSDYLQLFGHGGGGGSGGNGGSGNAGQQDQHDQPLGRGERSKKKRRFRSLSPYGNTPDATAGYGGAGGGLQDWYDPFPFTEIPVSLVFIIFHISLVNCSSLCDYNIISCISYFSLHIGKHMLTKPFIILSIKTGNDKTGDAHTAKSGARPSGPCGTDRMDHG